MKRFLIALVALAAVTVAAVQYDAVFDDVGMLKPESVAVIRATGQRLYDSG